MQAEIPIHEDLTLAAVRRRSQGYLNYLFWVCVGLCILWAANTVASLLQRWVALLCSLRDALGLRTVGGPDYVVLFGVAIFGVAAIAALGAACWAYRVVWSRRLREFWRAPAQSRYVRIRPLKGTATGEELRSRTEYLHALLSCPSWSEHAFETSSDPRESYKKAAETLLRTIETDIAKRAVVAGLVIGLNRNSLIDILSIAASAMELQLHVLTRLGKRPSLGSWVEMLKRTSASLFLNSYVSRGDALYLNLAIRKAAVGLEMASETVNEAAATFADVDWDEVLQGTSVPGLATLSSVVTMGLSVGAFGLRQIGNFIETTANDLVQGVLAAGILYYHGMSLAADCLALDEEHRHSPEMTRTIGQAMNIACAPAGRLLRDQVRRMREFLRERRRLVCDAAAGIAKDGLGRIRTATSSTLTKMKEVAEHFRETSTP